VLFFFPRTCRRAAYHYIKKTKGGRTPHTIPQYHTLTPWIMLHLVLTFLDNAIQTLPMLWLFLWVYCSLNCFCSHTMLFCSCFYLVSIFSVHFICSINKLMMNMLCFIQFGIRSAVLNAELPQNSRLHIIEVSFLHGFYQIICNYKNLING